MLSAAVTSTWSWRPPGARIAPFVGKVVPAGVGKAGSPGAAPSLVGKAAPSGVGKAWPTTSPAPSPAAGTSVVYAAEAGLQVGRSGLTLTAANFKVLLADGILEAS